MEDSSEERLLPETYAERLVAWCRFRQGGIARMRPGLDSAQNIGECVMLPLPDSSRSDSAGGCGYEVVSLSCTYESASQKASLSERTQGRIRTQSDCSCQTVIRQARIHAYNLETGWRSRGLYGTAGKCRFGSKEALLRAVVGHLATSFLEEQQTPVAEQSSAARAIENYVELYLNGVAKRESHMRALYAIMGESVSSVPEIRSDVARLTRGMRRNMAEWVRRGMGSGEFRADVDPDAAATMIIGLLRGVTFQALIDPRDVKVKELIPLVQRQIILSLT